MIGENDGTAESQMVLAGKPEREVISGLPRFVEVRGGAYFFLPGVRTLKFLAQLPHSPKARAGAKTARKGRAS